jgi:hypothetical protein
MKLKPTSLVLCLSAALFAAGVYVYESRQSSQAPNLTPGAASLFAIQEAEIQTLTIQMPQQDLRFARQNGTWNMLAPKEAVANDASLAYLTNLLATGRSDRVLTVPRTRKAEFGLAQPWATIEFQLTNRQTHRLVLGGLTYDRSAIYGQVDPKDQGAELAISLLPPQFENAVQRNFEEWLQAKPEGNREPL